MNHEESNNSQQHTGARRASESSRCPLINVMGANEHGIVVQSRRSFEIGSAIALGIHVQIPESRQTEFVSAETMVVESKPRLSERGDLVYQVTMVFSEISRGDRDLLLLVSHDESMIAPTSSPEEPVVNSPFIRSGIKSVSSLN